MQLMPLAVSRKRCYTPVPATVGSLVHVVMHAGTYALLSLAKAKCTPAMRLIWKTLNR